METRIFLVDQAFAISKRVEIREEVYSPVPFLSAGFAISIHLFFRRGIYESLLLIDLETRSISISE